MTIVRVEVHGDARPYRPGTAHVFVDGKLIAKLRTAESAEVETRSDFVTRVDQPLGLNEQYAEAQRREQAACEWCEGDQSLCDGTECEK